jgi:hypothetical protein
MGIAVVVAWPWDPIQAQDQQLASVHSCPAIHGYRTDCTGMEMPFDRYEWHLCMADLWRCMLVEGRHYVAKMGLQKHLAQDSHGVEQDGLGSMTECHIADRRWQEIGRRLSRCRCSGPEAGGDHGARDWGPC